MKRIYTKILLALFVIFTFTGGNLAVGAMKPKIIAKPKIKQKATVEIDQKSKLLETKQVDTKVLTTTTQAIILPTIISIDKLDYKIMVGDKFELPKTVIAKMSDGTTKVCDIDWKGQICKTSNVGEYKYYGTIDDYKNPVQLNLSVIGITNIEDISIVLNNDDKIKFPSILSAHFSDKTVKNVPISWNKENPDKLKDGIYQYYGTTKYYKNKIKYNVDKRLTEKINEILSKIITKGMNIYEKELAIHDYLINNTVNEGYEINTNDIPEFGVIVYGKGKNIVNAFSRLLTEAGIKNEIISGSFDINNVRSNEMWDVVRLENDYYHVDIAMDQALTHAGVIEKAGSEAGVSHYYFNLDDNKMSEDHTWNKELSIKCNGLKYWYFTNVANQVNDKIKEIIDKIIKPGMSDYEKELAVHDYLILNMTFNNEKPTYSKYFEDYDLIINGKGFNYNKAFNRIMNYLGIEAKIISGQCQINNETFDCDWNIVKLDGNYYQVDVLRDSITNLSGGIMLSHKFLNRTDSEMATDYKWETGKYPVCNCDKYDIMSQRNRQVEDKENSIIAQIIKPGMSDVEKEMVLHDYVVNAVLYDIDTYTKAMNKQNYDDEATNTNYAALILGKSMCKGYAEAFDDLLRKAGITSKVIIGEAENDKNEWINHAWNLVKLDDDYYHVDTTGDDPNYNGENIGLAQKYFNLNDSMISVDHKWKVSDYPVCNGTKYLGSNLNLIEKDENNNEIILVKDLNEFTNLITNTVNNRQSKIAVKVMKYDESYINTIQSIVNSNIAKSCNYKYVDDKAGYRYLWLEFIY